MKELIRYSQEDKLWKDLLLIPGKDKFGKPYSTGRYGCALVSCGIIAGFKPDETLSILKKAKAIDELGKVIWDVAAKALGCEWHGFSMKLPDYVCIGVTDKYKSKGFPTHFYVVLNKEKIIDPLDGLLKPNTFHNIGYRLFTKV